MQKEILSENFQNLDQREVAAEGNIGKQSLVIYIIIGILAAIVAGGGVYAYERVKTKRIEQNLLIKIQLLQNQVEQLRFGGADKASPQPQKEDDVKILSELFSISQDNKDADGKADGRNVFVYVFNAFDVDNPVAKIKVITDTNKSFYDEDFQLVGDKIYFYDQEERMTKRADFDGNIQDLSFTKTNMLYNNFLVSAENNKVVWSDSTKSVIKLIVADIDGGNEKILSEESNYGEDGNFIDKFFLPVKFSVSNDEIYFVVEFGGLGGYHGYKNLYRINTNTGKKETLVGGENDFEVYGISPNDRLISYFKGLTKDPKLVVRNIEDGAEKEFDIPIEEGFRGGLNAYFSPDSKYIAYNIGYFDLSDERFRTIVIDLVSGESTAIIDDPENSYSVIKWITNSKILLGLDDDWYVVNRDGSGLKKLNTTE